MKSDSNVKFRGIIVLMIALAGAASLRAQTEPADNFRIYVLTMQRGDAVWEKFGHNAIWIHDEAGQLDLAYNWGLFDFEDANFFRNFALGLMRYSMGASELEPSLRQYRHTTRTIWAQELDLSPAQKQALVEALVVNEMPGNSDYLYNYYTDNCSTRVRDAIDKIVGGQLKSQLEELKTAHTWRWHTRRLTQDSPLWYTALNTVIGPQADVPLTRWEECFIPMELHNNLAGAMITDEAGNERPLVKAETILFQSTRPKEPSAPPNWIGLYAAIGTGIGALNLLLLRWAWKRRAGRIAFGVYLTLYGLFIATVGMIALYFWIFTNHWGAHQNENLLAYSPLGLLLAIMAPGLIQRAPRRSRVAVGTALAIAGLTLLGLLLQALPMFDQVNGEPLALIIPMNLALAWSVWRYCKGRETVQTKVERSS